MGCAVQWTDYMLLYVPAEAITQCNLMFHNCRTLSDYRHAGIGETTQNENGESQFWRGITGGE